MLYPLLERLADSDGRVRQAALAALVSVAALDSDEDASMALPRLLERNMDYVVDAACSRLRRAKTATASVQDSPDGIAVTGLTISRSI